jgi:hypothetical protein
MPIVRLPATTVCFALISVFTTVVGVLSIFVVAPYEQFVTVLTSLPLLMLRLLMTVSKEHECSSGEQV